MAKKSKEALTLTIPPKQVEAVINEADYLNSIESLPFSTAIRADLYLKLKRVEYWDRTTIKNILESLLEAYLNSMSSSKKPLPPEEANKLKQLKTAKDYTKLRLESKRK